MILVTGAGGTVGSELLSRLVSGKIPFRAGYRSAGKLDKAKARGLDAVVVDFSRQDTLAPALRGIDTLFLLSGGSPDQTQLEIGAVREAKRAGVERIVKLSVWGAGSEAFSFARIHRPVEKEIEASGLAWTFLRPNGFMQNMATFFAPTIKSQNAFYLSGGTSPISHIDVRDIAEVASKILAVGGHDGMAYELSGPEALTYAQIAAMLSAVLERRIDYVDLSADDLRKGMLEAGAPGWYADALVDLMGYYSEGHASRVTSSVRDVTGSDPISFDRFARDYRQAFDRPAPR